MISKRIFFFHYRLTLRTFPSYASSSHDFEKNLFVSLQNHTTDISVICFEFTCFRKESFCFSTKSHCTHFRHMYNLHMISKILFLFHNKVTLITFPSLANALYSHSLFNSFLFSSML